MRYAIAVLQNAEGGTSTTLRPVGGPTTTLMPVVGSGARSTSDQADPSAIDASDTAWDAVAGDDVGPLQANATVINNAYDDFHPWPSAAAAAWSLFNTTDFSLLSGS